MQDTRQAPATAVHARAGFQTTTPKLPHARCQTWVAGMWLLTTTAGTPPHDKPEWLSALHSKQRTDNPAPGSLAPFGNSKQDPEPATRAGMHPPTRALETLQEACTGALRQTTTQ